MLPDLHTDFSGGISGGLVFLSLEEFSSVKCVLCAVWNLCCDPHKGFGVVNKIEVDVFLQLSCFYTWNIYIYTYTYIYTYISIYTHTQWYVTYIYVCVCLCVSHFLYPFIHQQTLRLFSYLDYCTATMNMEGQVFTQDTNFIFF